MRNIDAELAVLGACLVDAQAYWKVSDLIGPEDFSTAENRSIWETIGTLSRSNVAPDFVTVAAALPCVDEGRLIDLSANVPGSSNIRGYAEWVLQAAIERRVRTGGHRIANLRGPETLAEAQRILASCQPKSMSAVRSIRDFLGESLSQMQARCDSTETLTGVPTSLEWLDEQTSGWQRGDLVIVAARPSVGKTALALQCALHAAQNAQPVFFASLEQSGSQITDRAIAHLAGVSLQNITQPKRIEEHEWTRITNAHGDIKKLPFLIDETGALTVDAICARVRQANATNRLGLVLIDYLTQITPPKADTNANGIQMITRQLKALAKELSVPIILLSQLNRDGAEKPLLKHLRDSGAIEQDADVVIFLHRPDDTNMALVELTIAKQRNGPIGAVYLHADMAKMRFLPTQESPRVKTIARRGFSGGGYVND